MYKSIKKDFFNKLKSIILKKNIHFYFFLTFIIVAFLYPHFKNGDFLFQDLSEYYTPHHHFIISELREGRFPFWFPNYMFGIPEMFKTELGLFNPIYLIYYFVNYFFNSSLDINFTHQLREYFTILIAVLSSFTFFTVFINYFKDKRIVFTVSLIYSLSPILLYFGLWIHALIFIINPIVVNLLIKISSKNNENKKKLFVFLTLCNIFIFSIGYPPFIIYSLLIQFLFLLFSNTKQIFKFFISLFFTIGLSSFYLIPYYHIIKNSSRFEVSKEFINLKIESLIYLFYPYPLPFKFINYFEFCSFLFLGLIFSSFLVLGMYGLSKDTKKIPLLMLGLVLLLYSLGNQFGFIDTFSSFLPINLFRSTYQIIPFLFLLICYYILVGFESIEYYIEVLKKIILLQILISLIIFLVFIFKYPNYDNLFSSLFLNLIQIIFLYLFRQRKEYLLTIGFIFFLIFSLNTNRLQQFYIPKDSLISNYFYNKKYINEDLSSLNYRLVTRGIILKNLSYLNINTVFGYDWFYTNKFIELGLENKDNVFIYKDLNLGHKNYNDFNVRFFLSPDPVSIENFELKKTIELDKPDRFEHKFYYLYESYNFLSRYYIPKIVNSCSKNCIISNKIRDEVSYNIENKILNQSANFESKILLDNSNTQHIEINTNERIFVASTENYDEGWKLFINGREEKLYKSSNGFRGFFVDSGKSYVEMKYYPPYLNLGIIVSLISLLFFFLFFRYSKF